MAKHCSTCTCEVAGYLTAERALSLLNGPRERDLYRGRDSNRWFITYGGGEVHPDVVSELLERGAIRDKYKNTPNECYWTGKTIDMDATMAARKGKRMKDGWPTVYADGTTDEEPSCR